MPSPMKALCAALACAIVLGIAACASSPDPANPFRGEVSNRDQTITISVDNLDFNDATLRVVADGARTRLGTVNGKQQKSFSVSWPYSRDLSVQINLLAGDEFTTRRLSINPGENVKLIIQRPLYRSYLTR